MVVYSLSDFIRLVLNLKTFAATTLRNFICFAANRSARATALAYKAKCNLNN